MLAKGGPLPEYVSKDLDTLTAALITRWSLSAGHCPISAARLGHIVFRNLYSTREKVPPIDTPAAAKIQNQKVSFKLQKLTSQFLPPHLKPSWDRLRVPEVVAAFGALPNDKDSPNPDNGADPPEIRPLGVGLLHLPLGAAHVSPRRQPPSAS